MKFPSLQPREQKRVDRRASAVGILYHWQRRPHWRLERPEFAVFIGHPAGNLFLRQRLLLLSRQRRAGGNPLPNQVLVLGVERPLLLRRHFPLVELLPERALLRLSRDDRRPAVAPLVEQKLPPHVQARFEFPLAVTFGTARLQDRSDVLLERDALILRGASATNRQRGGAHAQGANPTCEPIQGSRSGWAFHQHLPMAPLWPGSKLARQSSGSLRRLSVKELLRDRGRRKRPAIEAHIGQLAAEIVIRAKADLQRLRGGKVVLLVAEQTPTSELAVYIQFQLSPRDGRDVPPARCPAAVERHILPASIECTCPDGSVPQKSRPR
jgi:hypothetical protein